MKLIHLILLSLLLPSFLSAAQQDENDEVLTIDQTITGNIEFSFPNDEKVYPSISDFKVLQSIFMSSKSGQRWVTITLKNTSSGKRILNQNHIMALFANGKRRAPSDFKKNFNGDETLTMTLYFGERDFPILTVYTREN